jgi:hypothetical protein
MDVRTSKRNSRRVIVNGVAVSRKQWQLIEAFARHIAASDHGASRIGYHFTSRILAAFSNAEEAGAIPSTSSTRAPPSKRSAPGRVSPESPIGTFSTCRPG